ncbi:MAG: ABC transporter ATP-binding protein [Rugosibacter sp.]|jgi:peptide/nickel transport system ATP-binding protein
MNLLTVKDLVIDIGQSRPIDGISFAIAAGECFALLGESGCGKSMTALALMRLLPPNAAVSQGSIEFAAKENQALDLLSLPEQKMRQIRGGGIGMIFQEPATSLNPVMRIGQQIGEALALHGQRQRQAARAIELLTQVGIPDPVRRLDEYPFQLSGGMKQRVMIAMALAGRPQLLIADEPTTALDVTIQAQVLDVLDRLRREQGMAVLLISHDLGVVARMADRVGVMYAGQLVETAPRAAFFERPTHPYAVRLFAALPDPSRRGSQLATIPGSVPPANTRYTGCRFAARCSDAMPVCRTAMPAWRGVENAAANSFANEPPNAAANQAAEKVRSMHAVRCFLECAPQAAAPVEAGKIEVESASPGVAIQGNALPLLAVTGLKVHFPIRRGVLQRTVGHVRAVDGVSFTLHAGRTLALVGESGCGKTTAGKAILQLVPPTGGQVNLRGQSLAGLSAREMRPLRAQMQMIFQDPFASLNPRMRVGEIIAEGMRALAVGTGEVGAAAGKRSSGKNPSTQATPYAARVAMLLERVGLHAGMADRYPHEFSGGQRQRIAIARALAVNPALLVCDEPTSALDVSVQAQILNLLAQLQREHQLAFLFITHNIAVVDYLAHEVAVMYLGQIVEQGTTDEVLRNPQHPYTKALLAAVLPVHGLIRPREPLSGEMPSAANPPSGCHFHPRCPLADAGCRSQAPLDVVISATHRVRCLKIQP